MHQRIRFAAPASLLAMLALSTGVAAQPRPPVQPPRPVQPATTDASQAEARRAYDQGTVNFSMGRYAEALTQFRRAYELRANPVVLVPIIECEQRLNHTAAAIRAIEQYLAANPPGADRPGMERQLAALRARPTLIHVTSDPPGAVIVVDGRPTEQVTPADVTVTPGAHTVTARRERFTSPDPLPIEAVQGDTASASLTLSAATVAVTPIPPPPPPPPLPIVPPVETPHPRGTSPAVYVAGAVAGAGLVAGTVFGLLALSDRSDYQNAPTRDLYDSGRRNALLSDVGFGVAVLSAGIAVVVYIAGRSGSSEQPPVRSATAGPHWAAGAAGVGVSF